MSNDTEQLKTSLLELSRVELTHLRDLMSILLPSGDRFVSQALADTENRVYDEQTLWLKVRALCQSDGINVDQSAPDFVVESLAPPMMGVVQVCMGEEILE